MGKLTDCPDMTIDVYHGSKKYNIILTPDKDLPNDSQTNIHSNKTHFSSLFLLPRIKSLRKQGTEDDLINTQYDLHYELLLMSVPRGWGGG